MPWDRLIEKVVVAQNGEGGWGYSANSASQPEPTSLALHALSHVKHDYSSAIKKGLDWLLSIQDSSGAFRVQGGYEKSVWPTALTLLTLIRLQAAPENIARAVSWLVHLQSQTSSKNAEEIQLNVGINPTLVGWGWTEKTFAWVDPTAWACLALRHAGLAEHPRVKAGLQLLLDRAYDEGGANCGNRHVYGSRTEPVPANTSSLLLAFSGTGIINPRLDASCEYLAESLKFHPDLENLAWARIALEGYKTNPKVVAALPQMMMLLETQAQNELDVIPTYGAHIGRLSLALLAHKIASFHPFAVPTSVSQISFKPMEATKTDGFFSRMGKKVKSFLATGINQTRDLPASTKVSIARATEYDDVLLLPILRKQYEHFQMTVPMNGKRVVLKPNLVEYHDNKVINTNPTFISAVIAMCKEAGAAEVIVAEGPGHWRNVRYLVEASGLGAVLKKHGVRFVDINSDNITPLPNQGLLTGMERLYFAETIASAEVLVSLPKLKTHHWAGVTLSLKNMFGSLPGACYGWPKNELHWRGIDNSIVDIALSRTPNLAIIDGIIGMEGDGPLNGNAKPMGVMIMGNDPLAVDATATRTMGLVPERIGHLFLAGNRKLGWLAAEKIEQVGETIEAVKQHFQTAPKLESLSEKVESKVILVAGQ